MKVYGTNFLIEKIVWKDLIKKLGSSIKILGSVEYLLEFEPNENSATDEI